MDALTGMPVQLSVEWVAKTVTTDPPKLIPHEEWRLVVRGDAAAPVRAAVLLYADNELSWGLLASDASERIEVPLHFFPHDWRASDEVRLSLGWRSLSVVDSKLKADPPGQSRATESSSAVTGQVIPVCELRAHPITAALFIVAADDTEKRQNDRWRVRPELTAMLPEDLAGLTTGEQSGVRRITAERPVIG